MTEEKEKIRAHVFVFGRVQGVFFRAAIRARAKELGLVGWVRNLKRGQVEAILEGEEGKVTEMLAWMRSGHPLTKVKKLDFQFERPQGEFEDFTIEH